jgi:Spy/CpxP family protein refolding chaperone
MNPKLQTMLIITTTLLIGIILGALGSGALREKKQDRFMRMPPEQRFFGAMERIIRPTAEQKQTMDEMLNDRFEQLAALQDNFQKQIFTIYDSLRTDISAILTDEQVARLNEHLARGPKRFVHSHVERLAEELELTAEQKDEIEKIMAEFRPEPRNRDWSNRQRPPREHYQSFGNRWQEFNDQIAAVLTPEQRIKFEELMKHRRRSFMDPRTGHKRRQRPPKPGF